MAAASIMLFATLIGGGVDMARAYRVQNRLQNACDAGTLAGRRTVSTAGYDATARAQAATYFGVNFNSDQYAVQHTQFVTSSNDNGNTVQGTASADVDTIIARIFGPKTIAIKVKCSATMGVGNSDIVMVLDTTGSMSQTLSGSTSTRIQALRSAMKNFYVTVANATQGSNARVRYGFVPYSSSVNVGALLTDLDTDYLVDTYAVQSRGPVYKTVQTQTGWGTPATSSTSAYSATTTGGATKYSNTSYSTLSSCTAALLPTTAWTNNGSQTSSSSTSINAGGQQVIVTIVSQPQLRTSYLCQSSGSKYNIYSQPSYRSFDTTTTSTSNPIYSATTVFDRFDYKTISYDVSNYKRFQPTITKTGTNGANVTSTWKGCIEERQTIASSSFSFSSLTGMTPSEAYDLDIDAVPESDPSTRWAPMWPEVAYYRTKLSGSSYVPTNDAVTTTGVQAGSSCPYRSQILAPLSKSQFDSYADALSAAGNTYHDIGMLWGGRMISPDGIFRDTTAAIPSNGGEVARHVIFMTDGEPNADYLYQQAYGIEYHDRRITSNGSTDDDLRHVRRFRAICDAIKAKGVRVWVVAFTASMTSDLSYCASSNSAYTAGNSQQLNTAFQEIAKQVGELRIAS